ELARTLGNPQPVALAQELTSKRADLQKPVAKARCKNTTGTPDEENTTAPQMKYEAGGGRLGYHRIFPEGDVTDAEPLRGLGGAEERQRCGNQEGLSQARQEASSRQQQERSQSRRAFFRDQHRQRDSRRRGKAQAVRPRRDRCRGQAALPGLSGWRRRRAC